MGGLDPVAGNQAFFYSIPIQKFLCAVTLRSSLHRRKGREYINEPAVQHNDLRFGADDESILSTLDRDLE